MSLSKYDGRYPEPPYPTEAEVALEKERLAAVEAFVRKHGELTVKGPTLPRTYTGDPDVGDKDYCEACIAKEETHG